MRLDVRSRYLTEMGVPQWYTRKRLLGAAESPVLTWPEVDKQGAEKKVVVAEQAVTNKLSASVAQVPKAAPLARMPDQSGRLESKAEAQESSEDAKDASSAQSQSLIETSLNLHLRMYRFGSWLLVDESSLGMPDFEELRLLENIVYSCLGESVALSEKTRYDWPVFNRADLMRKLNFDPEAFLDRWVGSMASQQISQIVLHGVNERAVERFEQFAKRSDLPLYCYPENLSCLIAQPAAKAEYWAFLYRNGLTRYS